MKPEKTSRTAPNLELRPAAHVMNLGRMGCFHQTRLSFMRALLRNLQNQQWSFERASWEVDDEGVGTAVYRAVGPERTYSLICFAHDLPDDQRSDRVIATAWDATFTLFDGIPKPADIERLRLEVPRQEAGHCSQSELVLARANRSVRLFEHVMSRLSAGQQPDRDLIDRVGYLMRTTAVYGNGKFGISDRSRISDRPEFASAFHTELLAVWLIRWFTVDIVEHLARVRGGSRAVSLDPELRRRLGVGNSTGLGMAPFLVLHPALIHSWILARETALARVRALRNATPETRARFSELVSRMMLGVEDWRTDNDRQADRIVELKKDLLAVARYTHRPGLADEYPWDNIVAWAQQSLSMEGQELVVSLVIEPHGELVDDLADTMAVDESRYFSIDGSVTLRQLCETIDTHYAWTLEIDYELPANCARFWYYSEEKLEPRVGERFDEIGADKEHPLAYGRDVKLLRGALAAYAEEHGENITLAEFLLRFPQHRHSVRRVQITSRLPYAEIRDNLLSSDMMPVDLLRCKLSYFGASRFDPRSDRWIRINMYQHAPFPDEFYTCYQDDWVYPPL